MKTALQSRRILLYGDSITFSRVPGKFERYDNQTRWPGVAQVILGDEYDIIEEGLRGRTLKGENPFGPDRDGYKQFGPILASHLPVDAIVIMLGTNDAVSLSDKTAQDVANDLRSYFPLIRQWCKQQNMPIPTVIIIPPPVSIEAQYDEHSKTEYMGAEAITAQYPLLYKKVAQDFDALYLDITKQVKVSREDGVHLDGPANIMLGKMVAAFIQENVDRLHDTRHLMQPAEQAYSS